MEMNAILPWLEWQSWLRDTGVYWVAVIPVHEISHISKVRLSDEQSAILQTPPIIMENKHSSIMFKKEKINLKCTLLMSSDILIWCFASNESSRLYMKIFLLYRIYLKIYNFPFSLCIHSYLYHFFFLRKIIIHLRQQKKTLSGTLSLLS